MPFRNLVRILLSSTAAATSRLLRLGVVFLKRLRLDEEDVRLRRMAGVLRAGVDADQIAGNHLVVLKRDDSLAIGLTRSGLFQQLDGLLLAAIHCIVQRQFAQPEIVLAFDRDGDLLHRIDARVLARLDDLDCRRSVLARLDEVIVG